MYQYQPVIQKIPKVFISSEANAKMNFYVNNVTAEVSGLGIISQKEGIFLIEDIYIFKQEVTAIDTVLDQKEIAMLIVKMVKNGQDPSKLRLWWHSHDNMPVFWSVTDDNTISSFRKTTDWFISIVKNKTGENLCRLDLFKPFSITLETPLNVLSPILDGKKQEELLSEIATKVTIKKAVKPVKKGGHYVYGRNYDEDELSETIRPAKSGSTRKIAGNGNRSRGNRVTDMPGSVQDGSTAVDGIR